MLNSQRLSVQFFDEKNPFGSLYKNNFFIWFHNQFSMVYSNIKWHSLAPVKTVIDPFFFVSKNSNYT